MCAEAVPTARAVLSAGEGRLGVGAETIAADGVAVFWTSSGIFKMGTQAVTALCWAIIFAGVWTLVVSAVAVAAVHGAVPGTGRRGLAGGAAAGPVTTAWRVAQVVTVGISIDITVDVAVDVAVNVTIDVTVDVTVGVSVNPAVPVAPTTEGGGSSNQDHNEQTHSRPLPQTCGSTA